MKKYIKLFEEYIEEGVSDKMLANHGIMPDLDVEAELKYQQTLPDMGEMIGSVKGLDGKSLVNVYKNPKTLKGFVVGARAIIMENGDIYIADKEILHHDIGIVLRRKHIISDDAVIDYYDKPDGFITVQRVDDKNTIALGGSNSLIAMNVFKKYMDAAEKKNPQLNYINTHVQMAALKKPTLSK